MAGIDLGALNIKVKVDGLENAKNGLKTLTGSFKETNENATKGEKGVKGFANSLLSGVDASSLMSGAVGGLSVAVADFAMEMVTKAIASIKDFIAESFKLGIGFEAQMSKVKAITGATGEEFKQLNDIARQFGADTVFTTTEVAKAMEYMAMAGWDTTQIMSGMDGVLSLAAASGEDLALVSDTVTDALTAFGEGADQAGRMADVLSAAATSSNTNVGKMAYTFKYAAPIAGSLSYSMEDVAIATGLMANAGIKGETAGTALRSMFLELQGTIEITGEKLGKYVVETANADGSMRELVPILTDLRKAFDELTESERALEAESLVGKEAASAFVAVMKTSEEDFNKLTESIYNSAGAASEMSAIMIDNVDGLLKGISSKFESMKISLYTLFEPVITWVLKIGDVLMSAFEPVFKLLGDVGNSVLSVLDPIINTITALGEVCVDVIKGVCDIINDLLGPLFSELDVDISDIGYTIKGVGEGISMVFNTIIGVVRVASKVIGEFIAATYSLLTGNLDDFKAHTEKMGSALIGEAKATNEVIEDNSKQHYDTLENMNREHTETMVELDKARQTALNKELSEYEKKLKQSYDETTRSGREAIEKRLQHKREELEREYQLEVEHANRVRKYRTSAGATYTNGNRYANGTLSAAGGWSLVGEVGAELMYVPPQAQIFNSTQTNEIMKGQSYNFYGGITVKTDNADNFINELQLMTRRGATI